MADTATAHSAVPSAQDFTTPDRSSLLHRHFEEKQDKMASESGSHRHPLGPATVMSKDGNSCPPTVTVTPSEKAEEGDGTDDGREDNKQVRFDKDGGEGDEESSPDGKSPSKRGLVSRRGRGSPGRSLLASASIPSSSGAVEAHAAATAVLEFKTFRSQEPKLRDENDTVPSLCSTGSLESKTQSNNDASVDENKASSSGGGAVTSSYSHDSAPGKKPTTTSASSSSSKRNNVTFSPVPPPNASEKHLKTPVRSPSGGRVASLPNLYDAPMGSPAGIFLSPTTPTALERKTKAKNESIGAGRSPLTPRTPKRDHERSSLLTTPTDFAFDYGKHPMSGSLLDNSNVLSWLHSPSANGLFSPGGGLGSMLNTPKGGIPRTPRTPTVTSTSFFFSDVAGLPRGSELSSPSKQGALEKRKGNCMICISPLSSDKARNGQVGLSPKSPKLNMEMFASPAERSGMAKLGMKKCGVQSGGDLDAVHLGDRALMEDEDLNRLLQLAANTPRPSVPPAAVSSLDNTSTNRPSDESQNDTNRGLLVLGFPTIGENGGGSSTKLMRKNQSRDQGDNSVAPLAVGSSGTGPTATSPINEAQKDATSKPQPNSVQSGTNPFMTSYHHHEAVFNPNLYPGLSHGGSMRVVVGGPPRTKSGTSPGTIRYTVGRPGEFPAHYPPPSHYPQHHGVPPRMHPQYAHYPPPPPHRVTQSHVSLFKHSSQPPTAKQTAIKVTPKRSPPDSVQKQSPAPKRSKKLSPPGASKKKNRSPQLVDKVERQKVAATIHSVNQASGGKNDKAAALAAAILRGVTMRPSGKWQAQLYFAGKSRYIGVFDTREKAALAYEIARERLKAEKNADGGALSPKQTEAAVNAARKAAFDGVNERGP